MTSGAAGMPRRVLDTRNAGVKVPTNGEMSVKVTGIAGVPAAANVVVSGVSPDGRVNICAYAGSHLVVDVAGWLG